MSSLEVINEAGKDAVKIEIDFALIRPEPANQGLRRAHPCERLGGDVIEIFDIHTV